MSVTLETSRTVQAGPAEVPREHVVDHRRPAVADVRWAVDGRAAQVDVDAARLAGRQLADLTSGGVVQAQHGRTRLCADNLQKPRRILRRMPTVPEKPTLDGIESRWAERWETDGVYRFAPPADRSQVFSIDTPPPTVSGSIHMGTVFGYSQTDALARYQRMRGRAVYYPMGWDDNGLATERRVQNYYGVRCDPSQPYQAEFTPPFRGDAPADHQAVPISRPNFVELCHELTAIDEAAFEELFRRLGLSVDWTLLYTTIDDLSRRTSQATFLHNLARGEAYSAEAPTVWDVDDRTAVAQAEIEDRERPGAYHVVAFDGPAGDVLIETTRPELIVSCVAMVAHPDDERYRSLVGSTVRTPLYDVEVPVVVHPLAQPDKGTGIAMVCTFGDTTDVTWWRELALPTRSVIGRDGRFSATTPPWLSTDAARAAYEPLAGRTVKQAQTATVEQLRSSGALRGDPKPITHPVKFYERGTRPLEIVTSRQWYIRNGGRDQALRETMLAHGKELNWFPDHMRHRYEHWVEGLNGDWLISRQRFFGVPIPLWYPVGDDGETDFDRPIVPAEELLPARPVDRGAAGLHVAAARSAGRVRRRPGRHGHVGHVLVDAADLRALARPARALRARRSPWTCARRVRRSSAPGCSRRSCAPTSSSARCRGATPR